MQNYIKYHPDKFAALKNTITALQKPCNSSHSGNWQLTLDPHVKKNPKNYFIDLRLNQTLENLFKMILKSTRFYQLLRVCLSGDRRILQNNHRMQVLVCTVNSDSKFHNTKSKQVTAESVTGIYMEKLHYHVFWRMCLLFCLGRNIEI